MRNSANWPGMIRWDARRVKSGLHLIARLLTGVLVLATPAVAANAEDYRAKFATTVHVQPDAGSEIVATLRMDERLEVLGEVSGKSWLPVEEGGRRIGYVFAATVEKANLEQQSKVESLAKLHALDIATAEQLAKGLESYDAKSYERAYEILSPLADQGVAEAQFKIARMYEGGYYVAQDSNTAIKWLNASAGQGHAAAQGDLALIHERNGEYDTALKLYLQSAEQENCQAQLNVGSLFYRGDGFGQDAPRAAYWLSRASRCDDYGVSMEADARVRELRTTAMQRQRNRKHDVVAVIILLAIAYGLGGSGGELPGGSLDPCDDPSTAAMMPPEIRQSVCGM